MNEFPERLEHAEIVDEFESEEQGRDRVAADDEGIVLAVVHPSLPVHATVVSLVGDVMLVQAQNDK